MSKIKILAPDNLVIVDGQALTISLVGLVADDIWAVTFDNSTASGEVEYKDPAQPNQAINHIGLYQAVIAAHAAVSAQLAADQQAADDVRQAEIAELQAKLDGFDYKGQMVSFTREDRLAVAEADQALSKLKPAVGGNPPEPYIPDTLQLLIKFTNGTNLRVNRLEFQTEFFPAFFTQASTEFM